MSASNGELVLCGLGLQDSDIGSFENLKAYLGKFKTFNIENNLLSAKGIVSFITLCAKNTQKPYLMFRCCV